MLWLSLAILCFVGALGQSEDTKGSTDCTVCEDVLSTWHNKYRCAGEIDYGVGPMRACDLPHFSCQQLSSVDRRRNCERMKATFRTRTNSAKVWEALAAYNDDPYLACATEALKQCEPRDRDVPTLCERALRRRDCQSGNCLQVEDACYNNPKPEFRFCALCVFVLKVSFGVPKQ